MMRFITIFGASLILASCSMLPESWNVDQWGGVSESVDGTQSSMINSSTLDFSKVDVGQSMDEVLKLLGPAVQVDDGKSLAENYVKGGEVYDVLYFRGQQSGSEDLRALLFRENILVGIGWSSVE